MLTKRTKYKPDEFVSHYIAEGRNGKRAIQAINPNIDPKSAEVAASRLLSDVMVQALLENWQIALKSHVSQAINTTADIMNDPDASKRDRLAAAKDIMDRAGLSPVKKTAIAKYNIEQAIEDDVGIVDALEVE